MFNKWWIKHTDARDDDNRVKTVLHRFLKMYIRFPMHFDWELFWDTFDNYLTLHSRTWSEANHMDIIKILIKGLKLAAK
jgi:hypothetical protein